uniref:C-type lectin domain-containing protein n=1 Tax=Oreochromis niloticus TaxID=8128 RepID=I3KML2_ORENI
MCVYVYVCVCVCVCVCARAQDTHTDIHLYIAKFKKQIVFLLKFYENLYDPCYKCEDGWKQHGGKCYFFSTSKSSWNESSAECITKGGDLVKIDSSEEQSYDDFFWIGLTDSAVEGRWLWVDGSPLNESLTFWFSHEPDDWTGEDPGGEDCASMEKTHWFDISCKLNQKSICEKPAVALCD